MLPGCAEELPSEGPLKLGAAVAATAFAGAAPATGYSGTSRTAPAGRCPSSIRFVCVRHRAMSKQGVCHRPPIRCSAYGPDAYGRCPFQVRLERLRVFRHSARSLTVWAEPVTVAGEERAGGGAVVGRAGIGDSEGAAAQLLITGHGYGRDIIGEGLAEGVAGCGLPSETRTCKRVSLPGGLASCP
jgi:hypothetical protein